jgi:hypothetical protein
MYPDEDDSDDLGSVPEPQAETAADGDSGGKTLTRIGSGNSGGAGDGNRRSRRFGSFDPRGDIPEGPDFIERMTELFPELTATVLKELEWISKYSFMDADEEQLWLTKLRENPSAGDAMFKLLSCNGRLIAWVVKDVALDLASYFQTQDSTDLDSLVFAELFVVARQEFHQQVLHGNCADPDEFVPILSLSMTNAYARFFPLGRKNQLHKILRYRSAENELMQSREEKLTEKELANAISVSVEELRKIKKWNETHFQRDDNY